MINFIHRTAAIIVGVATIGSLFLITKFPSWIWVCVSLAVWALIVAGVEYVLHKFVYLRKDIPILSAVTVIAILGLILLAEWDFLRLVLVLLGAGIIGLLHAWVLPSGTYTTHIEKSYRRMVMMLWVFNCYGIITMLFAIDLFFQGIPFWIISLVAALVCAWISYMIWRLYYAFTLRRAIVWMSCVGLVVIELMWVFSFLPFGYTVLGLFVTWIWYITQLFFRFHFGGSGIVWKKQQMFLIVNAVLFAVMFNIVLWR